MLKLGSGNHLMLLAQFIRTHLHLSDISFKFAKVDLLLKP
jgi:hypothetical protein